MLTSGVSENTASVPIKLISWLFVIIWNHLFADCGYLIKLHFSILGHSYNLVVIARYLIILEMYDVEGWKSIWLGTASVHAQKHRLIRMAGKTRSAVGIRRWSRNSFEFFEEKGKISIYIQTNGYIWLVFVVGCLFSVNLGLVHIHLPSII